MNKKETSNCRKHVLNELKVAFSLIKENYKYIKYAENEREEILGAGEWLLDNIYLIEKEYKSIKENMPREYFDNLNKINEEDENPRVLEYAKEYINRKRLLFAALHAFHEKFRVGMAVIPRRLEPFVGGVWVLGTALAHEGQLSQEVLCVGVSIVRGLPQVFRRSRSVF